MRFGCKLLAVLCLIATLPAFAAEDGSEPAPERIEKALISNLKSQLVYGSFKNNFSLERSPSYQLLVADNVRYHTGLFSSPSGDISSAVKERCAALGGRYSDAGDQISAGTLLASREDNGHWVSKSVVVSPGHKVRAFTCERDAVPVVHAILVYKGSRTSGGNVFSADFYDFRVIEKTADFPSHEDRRTYLSNASAMGSKLADAELAPIVAAEKAERERQRQMKDRAAAEALAQLEADRAAAEAVRVRELKSRLPQFWASLKVGDETNCGLVIEVRKPLARIQFVDRERWINIEKLAPGPEDATCAERVDRMKANTGTQTTDSIGARVTRVFTGVMRFGGGGACGDLALASASCSGNVRVVGNVEQIIGTRIQVRVATSSVEEDARLPVTFMSRVGPIAAGSLVWDEAANWKPSPQ